MAWSPATPAPITSTLAGGTVPAAVMNMGKNLARCSAAASPARYPETVAWEEIKAEERARKAAQTSILSDVPTGLPALTRAVKLTKRAARVGFTWTALKDVLAKLQEEVGELEAEVDANDAARLRDELGDVLFVCANIGRMLDIDPEDALRATNAKFIRRFSYIEAALAADGRTPDQSDLAEMDALWDAAKAAERA